MATRPKAVIESRNGEEFSPITIAKNVLTDDGQNLHDILSDRKEEMMTPTIENSSSMFKVGQGDNVDYSSNVVNGAYENMVLKGKTMVNCIQEPSSQDVVLPYAFTDGQYVTINDTKESGALGVELKGQTLVNLVVGGNEQKQVGQAHGTLAKYNFIYQLDHTKTYTLYFEVSGFAGVNYFNISASSGNNGGAGTVNQDGKYKIKISPNSSNSGKMTGLWFYWETPRWADGNRAFVQNIVLLEGDHTNVDLPYFTGMASCKMPILTTTGKNLFDKNNVYENGFAISGYTKDRKGYDIKVQPNTLYTITSKGSLHYGFFNDDTQISSSHFDSNTIGNKTITTPTNCNILKLGLLDKGVTNDVDFDTFQIEEGSVATSYEPHKSSILSLPEEVVLRSLPNGVCDTFNTRTGEYIQRIGELVLDGVTGRQVWQLDGTNEATGISGFYLANSMTSYNFSIEKNQYVISDKFKTIPFTEWKNRNTEACIDNTGNIAFLVSNSKLSEISGNGFKQYLSQNPITVQYKLNTPIITKINLPSTLKSWNTTTHIYSEIPENTLYPTLSHSNPTYPVILKPSTKYSIVANSYSNNHTNSTISFNLGGATVSTTVGKRVTTITTPSTLSNELLTMSGRGNKLNNVMVIEGDVVGDEPYFEGICDCKSPILSNVGKNLYNPDTAYVVGINKQDVSNKVDIKANTQYTFYANGHGWTQVKLYNNTGQMTRQLGQNSASTKVIFTTTNDEVQATLVFYYGDNTVIENVDFTGIQLEEGSAATSYEPYKTNILSCETYFDETTQSDKTIVLRSLPNGVCDTLNVETGEYVQRIGEYTFNGTETSWFTYIDTTGVSNNYLNQTSCAFGVHLTGKAKGNGILCDKLPTRSIGWWGDRNTEEGICGIDGDNRIFLRVKNEKTGVLYTDNAYTAPEKAKRYLASNPVTVQYELATPIVSTIDVQGFPYAYTSGHVQLSSGSIEQSLTPKVEYSVVTNRNGQIRSNQKMVERHQKQLDRLQAMILTNLVNTQYEQTLTNLKYDLKNVREEVK